MLVRRHGSGTFVSEPKIAQELTMTSFTEDMQRRGMVPASRTLELRVAPAGAHLGRLLHVSPSEPVVVIERLRLADRETMAIETLHVRESLVPGLTAADLERQSFYELLLDRYGIEIVGGIQTIEPTVTNEEESEALGVPLHSPAFLFERTTRASAGRSSSTSARSTAATATGSSPSSTAAPRAATARTAARASVAGQYQTAAMCGSTPWLPEPRSRCRMNTQDMRCFGRALTRIAKWS